MGVRCGLTEIAPTIFEQMVAGEEPPIPAGEWYSIDKAWYVLNSVFRDRGYPLEVVIAGDSLHPQSPHTLDDFNDGGHEWYLGLSSPQLVRDAAEALSSLAAADFEKWHTERTYSVDFYNFEELKSAYSSAAASGNALMIMVS